MRKSTKVVERYLSCLEEGDLERMTALFARDAVVHSPLYGERAADGFYRDLFSVTNQSEIEPLGVFVQEGREDVVAARFRYRWTLEDGSVTEFECVDIFELVMEPPRAWWRAWGSERGGNIEIKKLTIIYDTQDARPKFQGVRQGVGR